MYEYRDNAVEFTTASGSQLRRQLRGPRYFISRVSASFIRGRPISRALRNAPLSSLRNERERETFENIKLVARISTIFSISWNNASKSISISRFPEKQKEKKIDRRRQTLEKFNELESALPSPQKQAKRILENREWRWGRVIRESLSIQRSDGLINNVHLSRPYRAEGGVKRVTLNDAKLLLSLVAVPLSQKILPAGKSSSRTGLLSGIMSKAGGGGAVTLEPSPLWPRHGG